MAELHRSVHVPLFYIIVSTLAEEQRVGGLQAPAEPRAGVLKKHLGSSQTPNTL